MQAFEALVAEVLEADGYWVRRGMKVKLTKADKRRIGRPSSPRWEIDLVAFRPKGNVVYAIECKSYLDSSGVDLADLLGGRYAKRYKLFTERKTRTVVLARLAKQLVEKKLCTRPPRPRLALAAGNIRGGDPALMRAHFKKSGDWLLFDREWMLGALNRMSREGYEDSVASMVAKILLPRSRQ